MTVTNFDVMQFVVCVAGVVLALMSLTTLRYVCTLCRLLVPVYRHRRFHGYKCHTFFTFSSPGEL